MTIDSYETKQGKRYRVRYRKPDGSQTAKRGFKTKKAAEVWAAQTLVSKVTGTFLDVKNANILLRTLGEEWLEGKKISLKPSSYRSLESAYRIWILPTWGNVLLSKVSHSAIQSWVNSIASTRSATTTQRAHEVLAGILEKAVRDGRIAKNHAKNIALPKKTAKKNVYLTHSDIERLISEIQDENYQALIYTLAYCGLRWGEATGLKVKYVDFSKKRILVEENAVEVGGKIIVGSPKSYRKRSVPVPNFLLEKLENICAEREQEDFVFGNGKKVLFRPDKRKSWFARAQKQANIPENITLHDLRHSAASFAVRSLANVLVVQRMLGHKSAAVTLDRYADLFEDDLDTVSTRVEEHRNQELSKS